MHKHLFVYGTLRECDYGWAREGYESAPVEGTTKGTLYSFGGFPYADFDGDGTITGDILTIDDASQTWHHIRRVELNAGYVEREVIVETSVGSVVCVAYDADARTKARTLPNLPVIPTGDWEDVIKGRLQIASTSAQRGVFG